MDDNNVITLQGTLSAGQISGGSSDGYDFVLYTEGTLQIPTNFFEGNTDMKSFSSPTLDRRTVSSNIFKDCTKLVSVKFRTIDNWGTSVFNGCTALKDIWIGTNRNNNGAFQFASDPYFPPSVTAIHVPSAYLDNYKSQSSLARYVDLIVGDYDIS